MSYWWGGIAGLDVRSWPSGQWYQRGDYLVGRGLDTGMIGCSPRAYQTTYLWYLLLESSRCPDARGKTALVVSAGVFELS